MAYLKWNALVISNAAQYTADEVKELIKEFREKYPDNNGLAKRSDKSYLNEWAVHALCYRWGICKDKVKNADLEFVMEPEVKFAYNLLGPLSLFFLKFYKKITSSNS